MRECDIRPEHPFQFTRNWFRNRNLPTFREYVLPEFAGKPTIYLEIGVFEGMSMVWMAQHVLTHPDSRGVGVDPWLMTTKLSDDDMAAVMMRAHRNISFYPHCQPVRGNSAEVLRRMIGKGYAGITKRSVDICMIDGDHNELAALDDARNAYQLVKPGGLILFDDVENDKPKSRHVKSGVQMFLEQHQTTVDLAWKHRYVEAYRKLK